MPSLALSTFLCLDALLNFASAWKVLTSPIPTSNTDIQSLVKTLGVYFVLAGGTMLSAARSKDVATRRKLTLIYIVVGVLHMIVALPPESWTRTGDKVGLVIDTVITGTYLVFFLRGEGNA